MIAFRYLVNDVPTSIAFYTDALGFKLDQRFGPAMAIVSKGVRFRNQVVRGPGGAQVLCEDPSGNPIELFQSN